MRFSVIRWAVAALFVGALFAPAAVWAAPAVDEFSIRCLPETQPAAYLRVQGRELRVAATQEELDTATPVKAAHAESFHAGPNEMIQVYSFPEVTLPEPAPGVTAKATLSYQRIARSRASAKASLHGGLGGEFRLTRKDDTGATWTYITSAFASPNERPGQDAPSLDLPDPSKLALTIETKIEGTKAAIGLRVKSGNAAVSNIFKNDKPVPARLEVLNRDGKSVHAQRGDLEKFGFT